MYEFRYEYVEHKCGEKAKLCYIDTENLIVYIKTGDIYVDKGKDVKARIDTSNYQLEIRYQEKNIKKLFD